VWKMLYIYVLGYEVDFGHMEALNLITNQGYAEKTVGYVCMCMCICVCIYMCIFIQI
jgi:AP-2 complex subunit alpha